MAKFKCPHCEGMKNISKFRTYFRGGEKQNIDLNTNKEILCDNCQTKMVFVPEEGNFESSYSSFSGLSPLEKQKLLRKRSEDDAKKQKYRQQDFEKDFYNA